MPIKDFILPLVFYKRLSDVFDDEFARHVEEFGDEETAHEVIEADYKDAIATGRKDRMVRNYPDQKSKAPKLLQCDRCAKAVMEWLETNGIDGKILKLRTRNLRERYIISDRIGKNESITENGQHYGVEVRGRIFDNLLPEGLLKEDWLKDFSCPSSLCHHSLLPTQQRSGEQIHRRLARVGAKNARRTTPQPFWRHSKINENQSR